MLLYDALADHLWSCITDFINLLVTYACLCLHYCLALHRELLARGASVDTTDHAANTALHWAAFAGNDSAILMLLAAGADVDATNQVYTCCHAH
jgi:ankyrin repeat protein